MITRNYLSTRSDDFFAALAVIVADHADINVAHGAKATLAFANAYCSRFYGDPIPTDRYRLFLDEFRDALAKRRAESGR